MKYKVTIKLKNETEDVEIKETYTVTDFSGIEPAVRDRYGWVATISEIHEIKEDYDEQLLLG